MFENNSKICIEMWRLKSSDKRMRIVKTHLDGYIILYLYDGTHKPRFKANKTFYIK